MEHIEGDVYQPQGGSGNYKPPQGGTGEVIMEERVVKSRGIPEKYRKEYDTEIVEYCSAGHTIRQFAAHVGASRQTVQVWKDKHPSFAVGYNQAVEACQARWESNAMALALGKVEKGNPAVMIFILKNVCGWRDKQEVDNHVELKLDVTPEEDEAAQ